MLDGEICFLYVDDDPASRKIMELLLCEVLGYTQLALMEDTQDIIHKLEVMNTAFDVIFLDIDLKPLDGYAVQKLLREHGELRTAKIVAVTADIASSTINQICQAGFDGFIGKPISYETFPSQLQHILDGEPVWEAM